MNTLIVIAAFLAVDTVSARAGGVSLLQDTAGNYNLNYNTEDASRQEQGFQGGRVAGTFTFKDPVGASHSINYRVGADGGFTAQGDIPIPVQETAAVAAVRAAHLAENARLRSVLPPLVEDSVVQFVQAAPAPVEFRVVPVATSFVDNTAEIEAVKAHHFAAHQEALARLATAYRNL